MTTVLSRRLAATSRRRLTVKPAEQDPWPRSSIERILPTPALVRPPTWMADVCRGVSIGVCVAAGTSMEMRVGGDVLAHAHSGEWLELSQDWVCITSWALALGPDGGPGTVLLHECAHLLNPYDGHGDEWRETLEALNEQWRRWRS